VPVFVSVPGLTLDAHRPIGQGDGYRDGHGLVGHIPLQSNAVFPAASYLLVEVVEPTDIEGQLVAVAVEEPFENQGRLILGIVPWPAPSGESQIEQRRPHEIPLVQIPAPTF